MKSRLINVPTAGTPYVIEQSPMGLLRCKQQISTNTFVLLPPICANFRAAAKTIIEHWVSEQRFNKSAELQRQFSEYE